MVYKYVPMPLRLEYGERSYIVTPIGADENGVHLEIDGQSMAASFDAMADTRVKQIFEPLPQDVEPTPVELAAMFIPAAQNRLTVPTLIYGDKPDAEALIANDLGITAEELQSWRDILRTFQTPKT